MAKIIKDLRIEVDKKEILRLLGHTSESRSLKDSSKKLVGEIMEFSASLIRPKGVYTIQDLEDLPEKCLFATAGKTAFCICTIGKDLEKKIENLSHRGELGRAVILDAIGSVAAESAAEHLNRIIADEAKRKKLYCSTRFSPGYGGWKLQAQRFIFDLLPAEKIGVRLNKSYMMIPRKSVSFAVNLSKSPFKGRNSDPCKLCGLKECSFRKNSRRSATL